MIDILKKGILIGVGLGVTSKTRLEELLKNAMNEAKMSEEEGRKFVNSILEQSEAAEKNMEKSISTQVRKILVEMHIPTREEIDSQIAIIEELNTKIDKLREEIARKN